MSEGYDGVTVRRLPILLNEHEVALITVFTKQYDDLEDSWSWNMLTGEQTSETAAKQFVAALAEHASPAFWISFRAEITKLLKRHDVECGTKFELSVPDSEP